MSTIINARSPYYLKYRNATNTLTNVVVELRIWSGLKSAPPTAVTYSVSKKPLVEEVGNYVVFEISEIIRDYLETEYFTEATDAVWVKADVTKSFTSGGSTTTTDYYLALDGWGNFDAGINPRTSTDPTSPTYTPMVLQSNKCIQVINGRDIRIPVFSEAEPTIDTDIPLGVWSLEEDYWQESEPTWDSVGVSQQIVDSDDSNDKIQYIIIDTENARTGDTITITSTVGNPQSETITVEVICEPRFDAYRGVYYNKFGALQTMWFPLKSILDTRVKDESYNRNTVEYDSSPIQYSTTKHTKRRFNVTGDQRLTLNTALLQDCYNPAIEQLLFSEQVWVEFPRSGTLVTLPVIVTTSNQRRKTGVNDKAMIQYTINFDFAFEKINNVR